MYSGKILERFFCRGYFSQEAVFLDEIFVIEENSIEPYEG